jgi:RimJ/RimL family protein N-acetyltransferase
MAMLPELIVTSRLQMRKPVATDGAAIYEAYGRDPDVAHFMIWRPAAAVTETQDFVAACIKDWGGVDRRTYVLTSLSGDAPIGMLDARLKGTMADIGYVLAKREWGKGLMVEAIEAVTTRLLATPNIHRVQATCDVENRPSRRVLEKSGFKQEGRLEAHTVHPNISDVPRACYIYARCKSDA